MGVRLLTSYVKRNEKMFFKDYVILKDCRLVFDGDALMWTLFRRNKNRHIHGGDYNALYYSFLKFFKDLKRHHINAYLVLDGGSNIPLKNDTICSRKVKQITNAKDLNSGGGYNSPNPLFFKMVFMEVLRDAGVKFVVAQGEADVLVAAVANKLACGVVTTDSDFFLFDVQHGIVALDLLLDMVEQKPESTLKCQSYHRNHLLTHLNLRNSMIHFLAVLMGNDYSVERYLKTWKELSGASGFRTQQQVVSQVTAVAKFLSQFTQTEDVITNLCGEDEEMKNAMRRELREYDVSVVTSECQQLCHALEHPKKDISEIFVHLCKCDEMINELNRFGYLNSMCIDIMYSRTHFTAVQCENVLRKPSICASENLRMCIYHLLSTNSRECQEDQGEGKVCIEEFRRAGEKYNNVSIVIDMEDKKDLLPTNIFSPLCTVEEKQAIILQLIGFPKDLIEEVEKEATLFVLAAYHWTHISHGLMLTLPQVKALLGSFLICQSNEEITFSASQETKARLDMDTAHQLCNFQSILFYLSFLNTLLGHPFVNRSVRFMVSGSCYHRFFEKLCKGSRPKNLLSENELNFFNLYLDIITRNTDNRFSQPQSKQHQQQPRVERNNQSTKKTGAGEKDIGNRFASLSLEDDESDNNGGSNSD